MSKVMPLDKKVWENAVRQKDHGAAFKKQGFEVLSVVPKWGWVVKLSIDLESILLFASEVKAATKDIPDLITETSHGIILNDMAQVQRAKPKKACAFSM